MDAERVMISVNTQSLFQRYVMDATPAQIQAFSSGATKIREAIRRAVEALDVSLDYSRILASNVLLNALHFSAVALDELKPKHMKGYGELSEEMGRKLEEIVSELQELIGRVRSDIEQGSRMGQ